MPSVAASRCQLSRRNAKPNWLPRNNLKRKTARRADAVVIVGPKGNAVLLREVLRPAADKRAADGPKVAVVVAGMDPVEAEMAAGDAVTANRHRGRSPKSLATPNHHRRLARRWRKGLSRCVRSATWRSSCRKRTRHQRLQSPRQSR